MNNEERQFANRVRRALDANLEQLPATTTARLAMIRRQALARKKPSAATRAVAQQSVLAAGSRQPRTLSWLGRLGVAAPLLAGILLFAGLYEHEYHHRISTLAEIDVGVLSDELPLSAYLDRGFNAYLAQQGE